MCLRLVGKQRDDCAEYKVHCASAGAFHSHVMLTVRLVRTNNLQAQRPSMQSSEKRAVLGAVMGVVLVVGLIAFFEVPVIHIDTSGRAYFLGQAMTPPATGVCESFGCHCLTNESLSMWLLRIGYIKVGGCP